MFLQAKSESFIIMKNSMQNFLMKIRKTREIIIIKRYFKTTKLLRILKFGRALIRQRQYVQTTYYT